MWCFESNLLVGKPKLERREAQNSNFRFLFLRLLVICKVCLGCLLSMCFYGGRIKANLIKQLPRKSGGLTIGKQAKTSGYNLVR